MIVPSYIRYVHDSIQAGHRPSHVHNHTCTCVRTEMWIHAVSHAYSHTSMQCLNTDRQTPGNREIVCAHHQTSQFQKQGDILSKCTQQDRKVGDLCVCVLLRSTQGGKRTTKKCTTHKDLHKKRQDACMERNND